MPLNDAARAAIAELAGEGFSDLSPDEVVALNDAGERLISAGRETADGPTIDPPVECGGLVLHPVTLCAADYIALSTRGDMAGKRIWHVVTALVHARDPEALDALNTRWKRWRETLRIRHRCSATRDELERAVLMVLGGDRVDAQTSAQAAAAELADYIAADDPALAVFIREKAKAHFRRYGVDVEMKHVKDGAERKPAPDVAYWARLAAEIATMTGTSAAEWMRTDRRVALKCFRDAHRYANAWAGAFPKAEAVPQEVVEAIRAMTNLKNRIMERRKRRNAEKEARNG